MAGKTRGIQKQLWRIASRSSFFSIFFSGALSAALFILAAQARQRRVGAADGGAAAAAAAATDPGATDGGGGRAAREAFLLGTRPRALVVVAAGLPRTGSTWVYNVLRILLRQRDPNSIAGWYADLMAIWKNHKTHRYDAMKVSWLAAYRSLNTSVLVKTHGPGAFKSFSRGLSLGVGADLTVLTHRDLRTEVRSWVYQNWNGSVHAGRIADTPFADPAAWVRVAHRILHERNSTLASIGAGTFLDIRYEDWNHKGPQVQLEIVRRLAAKLEWEFDEGDLRAAVLEARRIFPPADGAALMYNPVSKLHPGHTRIDAKDPAFLAALRAGYEAIERDPIGGEFLRSQGYM